ncbi:MAG TPA: glycine reductase [Tissierellia bacterium]|nr:glycine reductase [Tissierellia bacterium]
MFPVIKGAAYILAHTPDMVLHNGTTQTTERTVNPDSDYLKQVPKNLRSLEQFVSYPPNQTYIGNLSPDELAEIEMPWYDKSVEGGAAIGEMGEIFAQDEFIGWIKISDVFDLVLLEKDFTDSIRAKIEGRTGLADNFRTALSEGVSAERIEKEIADKGAEALIHDGQTVGCVKRAHDIDANLNAHVIFENLVSKASAAMALVTLIERWDIDPESIDYVIECSEEACGDMNQRGGGNFAKSIAEMAGLIHATGSDTRSFCAAPTHALINAAALAQSGIHKNVIILAGGSTAKLGMNGKDHLKKGLPILEDAVGGFAALISENDGVHPVLRTDLVGKHMVGTGSSPQAVISSLITAPLDRGDLKITDIDKYSVEMQNPDVTKPAGAGDVPMANYKMIAALGVMRKEMERGDIPGFASKHGMVGWAPTQGHIPSGVPYLGFATKDIMAGKIHRAMIVGKGSLFLGRLTNQFDGVSIVIETNPGEVEADTGVSKEEVRQMVAEAMRSFAASLTE